MAISGPSSYFTTTQAFLNHWADAEAAQGNTPITLDKDQAGTAADTTRGDLQSLFTELEGKRDGVEGTALEIGIERAKIVQGRTWLATTMSLFNSTVRAKHGATVYARNLALVPSANSGRTSFMKPMRTTSNLWSKVNAFRVAAGGEALELMGGIVVNDFAQKFLTTRTGFDTVEEREQQLSLDLGFRNEVQDKIYPILKVYRMTIPTLFAENSAVVQTLPLLTPEPGSTPAAPGLTGGWVSAQNRAEFTGTASPTAAVTQHQLRGCPQADYDDDIETVIATIEAGQPLTFQTTFGLTEAGATASFRLFAMTGDGHEKASETVVVTRPV